jgi:hypothetical protein
MNISDPKPVFIVGMNGSGTTVLLDCLNNHPNLYGFRKETKVIPNYISSLIKYGNLEDDSNFLKLLNDLRNEVVFKIVNGGSPVPIPENWKDLQRNLMTVVDYIFKYFALKEGKARWCEKTPGYAIHITAISQLFPNAKFIHIIRDGRDCAASLHRRWGYMPAAMIYRWKKVVHEAMKQGSIIGSRYHEVYYEEFTKDPVQVMRNLCSFLDIPFIDAIIESSRIRKFTGTTSKKIVRNSQKWRNYFNDKKLTRLELIAGSQLNRLGYVTNFPASDYNPSPLLLRFLLYYGYVRETARRIRVTLSQRDDYSLRYFSSYLLARFRTRYKI